MRIDDDISAADALALLSVPELDPAGLSRRRFLQLVGIGAGVGVALDAVERSLPRWMSPGSVGEALAATPLGGPDDVLVVVGMHGGNDGMNMVVPYADPVYATYRGGVAVPANSVLALDGNVGLHPNLAYLKSLWDSGTLAVVQGLGYPNPDLSHFNSMAVWMSGRAGAPPSTGWLGRWLDLAGSAAGQFGVVTVGSSLPLHLIGASRRGISIPEDGFGFGGVQGDAARQAQDARLYAGVTAFSSTSAGRGTWHDAIAAVERAQIDVAHQVSPAFQGTLPPERLASKLTVAARLINAGIGIRVLDVPHLSDFDHHSGEPAEHADRMAELDAGLAAFFAALDPGKVGKVTVMTFSEFGRTPWANDSAGTDHGTAAPHLVLGARVKGGIYGDHPPLVTAGGQLLARWERLEHTVDYRSYYATMLDGVLGGGADTVLGGSFDRLDLFRAAGSFGGVPGAGSGEIGAPTELIGVVPARLLDTRAGGGTPLGQGETITLPVVGNRGVPAAATAAVLNVTAVGATASTFVTVSPSGAPRPETSSLNVAGPEPVPNLVFVKLGGGNVDIYNNAGETHVVVDVVGYFRAGEDHRFAPLPPARVLDTRDGNGAPAGAVGPGAAIDVAVAGRAGVPDDAASVVMNVTVTEPTSSGFATVYPAGASRPDASNLNFVPGQTVPNLVVAKLGDGGRVTIFNSAGATHVVADVLGSFGPSGSANFVALQPARLLDTREIGEPVGQDPHVLTVRGRGGVPASGVSAAVVNLTATESTSVGYVTAFPAGQAVPTASNLNVAPGLTRANLAIVKLGDGGAIALFASAGTTHLVADVVGYFTS
jgi:uncharacterized protein (DUF1501 family)